MSCSSGQETLRPGAVPAPSEPLRGLRCVLVAAETLRERRGDHPAVAGEAPGARAVRGGLDEARRPQLPGLLGRCPACGYQSWGVPASR